MEEVTLNVDNRESNGSGAAYQLRAQDKVPGVVYGPTLKKSLNVSVVHNPLLKAYKQAGKTGFITLHSETSDLNSLKVRLKALQVNRLTNRITHVDFHLLDTKRPVRTNVPLSFVGKAAGTKDGGILSVLRRQIEVKCLPLDTPAVIEIDVSHLGIEEVMHLSDLDKLNPDKKYEFVSESDLGLVTVSKPAEEEKASVAAPVEGAVATDAAAATATDADAKPDKKE